ncbi:MAG: hypothetical protein C4338_01370 [Rhodanobacteraceae bacterium]
MMFNAAISLGASPAAPVRSGHDWRVIYEIFGIAYASMSTVILLFYLHALRLGRELGLNPIEITVTRSGAWRGGIQAGIGAISAMLAAALLPDMPGPIDALSGLTYYLIPVFGFFRSRRLRQRLAASGSAA